MKTRFRQISALAALFLIGTPLFLAGCGKKEEVKNSPQVEAAEQKKADEYAKDLANQGGPPPP